MLWKLAAGLLAAALVVSLAVGCGILLLGAVCTPRTKSGKVSGRITYGGYAVPVGIVTFHPERGKAVVVDIEGGSYEVTKVPSSRCTVTVSTALHRQTYRTLKKQREASGGRLPLALKEMDLYWWGINGLPEFGASTAGLLGSPLGPAPLLAASALLPGRTGTEEEWDKVKDMVDIPEKYADPERSGLSYTIKRGHQDIDIDIPKE